MKQFVMNISIHVEANTAEEALEALLNQKSLDAIARAIEANKANITEVYHEESQPELIN